MEITQQLSTLKNQIVDQYYFRIIETQKYRQKELAAAMKIQKNFKMYKVMKGFITKRRAANKIKRVYKGYKARQYFRNKRELENDHRQMDFFHEQATIIQRFFRGVDSRKRIHDFYYRKNNLKKMNKANEEIKKQLEDYYKTYVMEEQKRKEETARAEFLEITKNLHHLCSTKTIPGVYNSPYIPNGMKPQAFNVDIETHLKTAFKSGYQWKPPKKKIELAPFEQALMLFSSFKRMKLRPSSNVSITTPIFYINDEPHLGHLYTAILADSIKKILNLKNGRYWNNLKPTSPLVTGFPELFQNKLLMDTMEGSVRLYTGTDEHGQKIQQASKRLNRSLPEFCKEYSDMFRRMFDRVDVQYDDFIRTTEDRHRLAVLHFWEELRKNGCMEKGTLFGYYSTIKESFLTEKEIGELKDLKQLSDVEKIDEQNYLFKIQDFKEAATNWIKSSNPIFPEEHSKALLNIIRDFNPKLSISRPKKRIHWGIPIPEDSDQTIYVWLDALINYYTLQNYPNDQPNTLDADDKFGNIIHIIGKDILRFHGYVWPCFLSANKYPLPKSIIVHNHWLFGERKMSKSYGNIINPEEIINKFGPTAVRLYCLTEGPLFKDVSYDEEILMKTYNSHLLGSYGMILLFPFDFLVNLAYRISGNKIQKLLKSIQENYDTIVLCFEAPDFHVIQQVEKLAAEALTKLESIDFKEALSIVKLFIEKANQYVEEHQFWKITDPTKLYSFLYLIKEILRIATIFYLIFAPEEAHRMIRFLNYSFDELNSFDNCKVQLKAEIGSSELFNPQFRESIFLAKLQS